MKPLDWFSTPSGWEALWRRGVAYEFHIDRLSVAPVFNADLIGETETTLVYGLTFGWGF